MTVSLGKSRSYQCSLAHWVLWSSLLQLVTRVRDLLVALASVRVYPGHLDPSRLRGTQLEDLHLFDWVRAVAMDPRNAGCLHSCVAMGDGELNKQCMSIV